MVFLEEDPVSLIAETTNQFHTAPDKNSLTRISGSLHSLAAARQSRLDQQHHVLKSLSRRLNNLQSRQDFEESRHDAGKHASEILELDSEKFRIAKGASDLEIEGERLRGELAGLRQQLEILDREGAEGGRRVGTDAEDEVLSFSLKLNLYRSLGISISRLPESGELGRAVITNVIKGDVEVIDVNDTASKDIHPKLFWQSL
ncbi:Spc24-domain-containing protein [Polychaeton citri CBS 116435]|uniref:Kinetochore protein Spc24 n=1 Tax=Polychaeton citri CBS 116435 TaxID=1314669 RepID=A0A9P4Q7A0_9PEZI|nr:Spc24-domain-containing protein [Polychaeton citri CBS 116435]